MKSKIVLPVFLFSALLTTTSMASDFEFELQAEVEKIRVDIGNTIRSDLKTNLTKPELDLNFSDEKTIQENSMSHHETSRHEASKIVQL